MKPKFKVGHVTTSKGDFLFPCYIMNISNEDYNIYLFDDELGIITIKFLDKSDELYTDIFQEPASEPSNVLPNEQERPTIE